MTTSITATVLFETREDRFLSVTGCGEFTSYYRCRFHARNAAMVAAGLLNRLHAARLNLEAISFELKLPMLVIPGAAPQLHP
jgi:hypothetical protein